MKYRITSACLAIALLLAPVRFSALFNAKNVYSHGTREEKVIALTFDDGPHPVYTDKILDVLARYNAKATFFVIGVNVKNYPEPFLRAVGEGHEIGNHTYDHKNLRGIGCDAVIEQLARSADLVYRLSDYGVSLMRPPQGAMDEELLSVAEELGYRVIIWDVDTRDWASEPSEKIVQNVLKNADNGDIILFHDYHVGATNTVDALNVIIPTLQKQGYRFVTVSELLDE